MSDKMIEMIPLFVVFPTVVIIVKTVLDYNIRKRLIDKGIASEEAKNYFHRNVEMHLPSSLKWGMVLVLIGLVMVIMELMPVYLTPEFILGVILLAAGVGLLAYYILASIKAKENKNSKL
jgi:hypothetical protein